MLTGICSIYLPLLSAPHHLRQQCRLECWYQNLKPSAFRTLQSLEEGDFWLLLTSQILHWSHPVQREYLVVKKNPPQKEVWCRTFLSNQISWEDRTRQWETWSQKGAHYQYTFMARTPHIGLASTGSLAWCVSPAPQLLPVGCPSCGTTARHGCRMGREFTLPRTACL